MLWDQSTPTTPGSAATISDATRVQPVSLVGEVELVVKIIGMISGDRNHAHAGMKIRPGVQAIDNHRLRERACWLQRAERSRSLFEYRGDSGRRVGG